jgi:hypothetical protein
MAAPASRTFRTRRGLLLALAAAGIFWASIFLALLPMRGEAGGSLRICAAFVLFFGAMWAYYARVRITLDEGAMTYRNLWRRVRVPFTEILKVEVSDALLFKTYLVATRRGLILFSSHMAKHRDLCRLLIERAGLRAPA